MRLLVLAFFLCAASVYAEYADSAMGVLDTSLPQVALADLPPVVQLMSVQQIEYSVSDEGNGQEYYTLTLVSQSGAEQELYNSQGRMEFAWLVEAEPGTYHLKLECFDSFLNYSFAESNPFRISDGTASAFETPLTFEISSVHPNPFNPTTSIEYSLDQTCECTLQVYNVQGQVVRTLYTGLQDAGVHVAELNGESLSSGLYFVQLKGGLKVTNQKITLIK